MRGCRHKWEPMGEKLNWRMNRMMSSSEPVAHVECAHCGDRTWLTLSQYRAIQQREGKSDEV